MCPFFCLFAKRVILVGKEIWSALGFCICFCDFVLSTDNFKTSRQISLFPSCFIFIYIFKISSRLSALLAFSRLIFLFLLSSSGLIVASLMLCWLPNQIRRLMMAAVPKSDWTLSFFRSYVTLHPVADSFFYLSSVINPFLYNLSSRQFRKVFLQVLRCRLTIEHVNKRTVLTSNAVSSRSLRPLLRSLRRSRPNTATQATSPTLPKESDSGMASLSKTETSDSILEKKHTLSESEI